MPIKLERPAQQRITTALTKLEGWYASESVTDVVRVTIDGCEVPVRCVRRADVERAYPDLHCGGFDAIFDLRIEQIKARKIDFECRAGDLFHRCDLEITDAAQTQARHWNEVKAAKQKALRQILQCPVCRSGKLRADLHCGLCHNTYEVKRDCLDLLPNSLRAQCNIEQTTNVSHHPYSEEARQVISEARSRKGLILDCGAGCRFEICQDIVCLEIAPFPSTDVMGVGQSLPFQDNSFEAVLSTAVLEHVTDPFLCAKEIVRVTRPGGTIFCTVPFLQPEHGYPHHYYNMTQDGLINLFADEVKITQKSVPSWGHPLHSIAWFLSDYYTHLPKETAREFQKLTVQELIRLRNSPNDPIFRDLSAQGWRTLAASTLIVATKP